MTANVATPPSSPGRTGGTVHERYRHLRRSGFTQQEATSLIARADGIVRHAEGEEPVVATWRWQEIARLEFIRYLVNTGMLSDGGRLPGESDALARIRPAPGPALGDTTSTAAPARPRLT